MIPQMLEMAMLLCFGCSWPMSVYKNAKAKTARSMSLQFILLIILGYVAGIAAKLYTHTFNYVLAVYVLNLIIVSADLAVYFINRRYDRLAEEKKERTTMKLNPQLAEKLKGYEQMNQVAKPHGVVLFGSSYLQELPICELVQDEDAHVTVHNRSVEGLTIDQAEAVLEPCVLSLEPDKIFISIGDEDIQRPQFDPRHFLEQYQWLLYTLHSRTPAKIYIVSVMSSHPAAAAVNEGLQALASETGCKYVNGAKAMQSTCSGLKLFDILRFYIRSNPITFEDAMGMAGY